MESIMKFVHKFFKKKPQRVRKIKWLNGRTIVHDDALSQCKTFYVQLREPKSEAQIIEALDSIHEKLGQHLIKGDEVLFGMNPIGQN